MIYKKCLVAFITLVFFSNLNAQNDWVDGIFDETKSLYELEESFENYWQNKEIGKGKGWKPFKRRQAFMSPRVYPDGIFPHEKLFQEWEKIKNIPKNTSQSVIEANWQAYGPTIVPYQNNGDKRGVGRINVIEFDPNNSNIIWIGSPSGGLWKTVDGGQNWTVNNDLLPNLGVSDIAIDHTNPNIMYIITGDRDADDTYAYGLMKSIDGGSSWNPTGLSFDLNNAYRGNRVLINPDNTNILLVSTRRNSNGETYRSTDGGNTWDMVLQGPNLISMEFNPSNPNIVYGATSGTGKYYRSSDNGQNWNDITLNAGLPNSGNNRGLIGVTTANPNVVYVLFSNNDDGFGGIYKSTDGGFTFSLQSDSPNLFGYQTDGSDEGGQGWYDMALAVSPIDENEVYLGGINLWKSENSGLNWDITSHWFGAGGNDYVHADQHYLIYNPSNNTLYAGNDGGIYRRENNSWTDISDGLQITQFYKIGISQTNYGLILGGSQDNGTLRCNSSNDWDAVRGGDGMECAIDPTNPDIMYSELYYGDIGISYDGGDNWNDISPDNNGEWITPYQIDQTTPNRIVIGYDELYESFDYGANWSVIGSGFNNTGKIDVVCLAPSNQEVIYIAENQDIFKTTDGGDNWNEISDGLPSRTVTYIAVHPTNSNRVWATFSGYSDGNKVYYSEDGGLSWENISSNLPNLPTNCILYYTPNETLFVGTDIGIFYKDSTMSDWLQFNQGLPNVIVTELEYHIDENKLFAGTYGRGLWVTSLPSLVAPSASFDFTVTNECSGTVNFNSSSSNAVSIEWDFGDNTYSNEISTSHQYLTSGNYTVKLIATNELGSDTIQESISINPVTPPTANDVESCTPSSVTLTATLNNSEANLNWYDAPVNGNLLHVGNEYNTELLNASTVFYVASVEETDSSFIGQTTHTGDSDYSGSANSVGSLEFDVNESFILESVEVYTNQAGERKINLVDNQGTVIHEHTEFIPANDNTPYTISLNFLIEAGESYRLTTDNDVSTANFGGTNPQLKRSGDNTLTFPYTFNNIVSINGSYWYGNGGEFLTDYYYYFYNWKVKTICSSARTPVTALIGSSEDLLIETVNECVYDSVTLSAVGNFVSFEWDNQFTQPSLTVYSPGTYSVTATDALGCSSIESINIPLINSFEITGEEILCEGANISLQCMNGLASYLWSNGEVSSGISVNTSGTYSVSATDINGCELYDEVTIQSVIPQLVEIDYDLDSLVVCRNSQADFSVSDFDPNYIIWNNTSIGATYTQTFYGLGETDIVVSAQDANGCESFDTLSVKVINCPSSINEVLLETQLFPNPNNGEFVLQHQSIEEEIKSIRIFDIRNRLIEEREVSYQNGIINEKFNLRGQGKGIFLIVLDTDLGQITNKIVIN
ncbi:MAG: VPS10 domain-containing protein [Flavobacteriales bacterium]